MYEIILDDIKKSYQFTENNGTSSLRHKPGRKISLLPYNTKFETKNIENVIDFNSVLGGFSRIVSGKKLIENFSEQDLIEKVLNSIQINDENRTAFMMIIKEIFFNESEEIQTFHPIIFNYISESSKNDLSKNLSKFLSDVLYNNEELEIKEEIECTYDYKPNNILLKLLIESMPELTSNKENGDSQYKNILPFVSEVFIKDFMFMIRNPKFYIEGFEMLLKFYYFFYVSQLSLKLKNMFNADLSKPEELYFNLDFENTSKTRISYNQGWRLLSSNLGMLYSHANCLELLNHNNVDKSYSYTDLKDFVDSLPDDKKSHLSQQVGYLVALYKEHINDVPWNLFTFKNIYEDEDKVYQKIYELFKAIDFQFNRSSTRNKPYRSYSRWFEEYCKANFLRKRGSLGYTLNITEDYLLFITKLCINHNEKVRLKNLFDEYEKRGLYFDMDSKNKIIQLFEKLNLIEKKSDSGDAQYVKSIL